MSSTNPKNKDNPSKRIEYRGKNVEFQEQEVFLLPKHLRVMELVLLLTPNTDFDFTNDYLRVQEWVYKMVTFSLLEDTTMVHLISMFQKMELVLPLKINEVPIIS